MDRMVEYFIEETNRKFGQIADEMKEVKDKLSDLQTFKIQMMSSAKLTSFFMSAIFGITTFVSTVITVFYMIKNGR
jgi:hypothetical protein